MHENFSALAHRYTKKGKIMYKKKSERLRLELNVDTYSRKWYTLYKTTQGGNAMAVRGRKTLAQKIEANKAEQAKCEERLVQLKKEEKDLFIQVIEEYGVSVEDAIKAIQSVGNIEE